MLVEGQWCGCNGGEVVIWHGFVPRTHLRSWNTSQAQSFQGCALLGDLGGDGNLINGLVFLPQLVFPEVFVDLCISINA